jgi:transposase-like protein
VSDCSIEHTSLVKTSSLYHRHRFPAEIIGHCVWLYFRFALSFRNVAEMLAMRGVVGRQPQAASIMGART